MVWQGGRVDENCSGASEESRGKVRSERACRGLDFDIFSFFFLTPIIVRLGIQDPT